MHREIRNSHNFLIGTLRVRENSEDIMVGGRIILKWTIRHWSGMLWFWIRLAEYTDRCRALVNTEINPRVL
jgi:hypothetical protein